MTDSSDIAWMRRLTEEGVRAPFRGGSILLAAGLIYGVASFVQAAIWLKTPEETIPPFGLIWAWATGLYLLVLAILLLARRGSGGAFSAANRASRAAWSTVGWGIFAMMATISAYALKTPQAVVALGVIPSTILVFYGMGWAVSAAMFRSRNLAFLAAGCFVSAPMVAWLTGTPGQDIVFGLALILFAALPGFLLMQAARQSDAQHRAEQGAD